MALKDDYKDDILDVSVNTKRKYRMTENADGTISLDDETVYTQEGDSFGASDLNAMAHAINNTSSDAEHTSYDNTTSGLVSDNVQGAIDEINDNLSGFKFYPSGTQLVAYIDGNGWYVDTDGNYIVWGTATAQALVQANPNTFYGRQSEEDCRGKVGADTATPFRPSTIVVTSAFQVTAYNGGEAYGQFAIDCSKYTKIHIDEITGFRSFRLYDVEDGAFNLIYQTDSNVNDFEYDISQYSLIKVWAQKNNSGGGYANNITLTN